MDEKIENSKIIDNEVLVKVENLSKKFCHDFKKSLWYGIKDIGTELMGHDNANLDLRDDEFWAVNDVSFELKRGECLGLIGRNGAGKSTLLKMLNGLIKPDRGSITMRGRVGALIELGAGFNPILTGRENVYINGAVLGFTKKEIDQKFDDIVKFAEIEEFIDSPVQSYSSGMKARLGFAVAAQMEPDVLLIDEVLAVGDIPFQRKCMQKIMEYIGNKGCIIFVSHNMHMVQSVCTNGGLLNKGKMICCGETVKVVKEYFNVSETEIKQAKEKRTISNEEDLVIKAVEIFLNDAKEGPIVTGGDCNIRLHYCAKKEFHSLSWGFSIWTEDLMFRITTATSSWENYEYNIEKGEGFFSCKIKNISLLPGKYYLKAGIYDSKISWPIARIGWDDEPVIFGVEGPDKVSINRQMITGDIIYIDTSWESQ